MIARKGAYVVVADGGGATIYRIATRVNGVKLDDVEAIEVDTPSRTADMGRDAPPRVNYPTGHSSSIEARDLHDAAEQTFAEVLAERLDRLAEQAHKGVVLFAAPRFLGMLRPQLSDRARKSLKAEIDRDLRPLRLAEIERALDALD